MVCVNSPISGSPFFRYPGFGRSQSPNTAGWRQITQTAAMAGELANMAGAGFIGYDDRALAIFSRGRSDPRVPSIACRQASMRLAIRSPSPLAPTLSPHCGASPLNMIASAFVEQRCWPALRPRRHGDGIMPICRPLTMRLLFHPRQTGLTIMLMIGSSHGTSMPGRSRRITIKGVYLSSRTMASIPDALVGLDSAIINGRRPLVSLLPTSFSTAAFRGADERQCDAVIHRQFQAQFVVHRFSASWPGG